MPLPNVTAAGNSWQVTYFVSSVSDTAGLQGSLTLPLDKWAHPSNMLMLKHHIFILGMKEQVESLSALALALYVHTYVQYIYLID